MLAIEAIEYHLLLDETLAMYVIDIVYIDLHLTEHLLLYLKQYEKLSN